MRKYDTTTELEKAQWETFTNQQNNMKKYDTTTELEKAQWEERVEAQVLEKKLEKAQWEEQAEAEALEKEQEKANEQFWSDVGVAFYFLTAGTHLEKFDFPTSYVIFEDGATASEVAQLGVDLLEEALLEGEDPLDWVSLLEGRNRNFN